jgi:hypothetical protein
VSAERTPGPWDVDDCGIIRYNEGNDLLVIASPWEESAWDCEPKAVANARFIVTACNAFPELVATLREMLFNARHGNGLEALHQAHDRAEALLAKLDATP